MKANSFSLASHWSLAPVTVAAGAATTLVATSNTLHQLKINGLRVHPLYYQQY